MGYEAGHVGAYLAIDNAIALLKFRLENPLHTPAPQSLVKNAADENVTAERRSGRRCLGPTADGR